MNAYFLVEGFRTETRVYPKWIESLCPKLIRVAQPHLVRENNYCLQSGYGSASLIHTHLTQTIEDLNRIGNFDFLVLCLDSDGRPIADVKSEIQVFLETRSIKIRGYELKIIVQNVAIETWFLGNRKVFQRNPENAAFRAFIQHYDVSTSDPERMPIMEPYSNLSTFHHDYLKLFMAERNMTYTKVSPHAVTTPDYLDQLILRTQETDHLPTLKTFFDFCAKIS